MSQLCMTHPVRMLLAEFNQMLALQHISSALETKPAGCDEWKVGRAKGMVPS